MLLLVHYITVKYAKVCFKFIAAEVKRLSFQLFHFSLLVYTVLFCVQQVYVVLFELH